MSNKHILTSCISCADDKGTISYGLALSLVEHYNLTDQFQTEYGIAGDWEDVVDGSPIGLDLGELIMWISDRTTLNR